MYKEALFLSVVLIRYLATSSSDSGCSYGTICFGCKNKVVEENTHVMHENRVEQLFFQHHTLTTIYIAISYL